MLFDIILLAIGKSAGIERYERITFLSLVKTLKKEMTREI